MSTTFVDEKTGIVPASLFRKLQESPSFRACVGTLPRFVHGWYFSQDLSDRDRLQALQTVLPDDVLLAGETAALLYGVELRESQRMGQDFRICMVRPAGKRALRRPGIHCRVMQLHRGDVITYYGLRVTSPLRTVLDLVLGTALDTATHLLEVFLQRGLVSKTMIQKRLGDLIGYRGVKTLRKAMENLDVASESPMETAVRLRLNEAGLPPVRSQLPVARPGEEHPYRVDLGWPDAPGGPIGVEVQSVAHHPLTGPKYLADQLRQKEIEAQGWRIIEVRTRELWGTQPTFEQRIAETMGVAPPTRPRQYWGPSKWSRTHDKWRQDGEKLWPRRY